jgi:hypothetical protein
MSIHLIAKELYALHQEVEKLEDQVKPAPPETREAMKDRLRKLKGERDRMPKVLEGAKEPPVSSQPL